VVANDSDGRGGNQREHGSHAGHVRTWASNDAVIAAAWMASGVFDVRDDL